MSGTHHQLLYHLVFSTKCRKHYLHPNVRATVFEYLGGIAKGLDAIPLIVGGWVDHVHLLVKLTSRHRLCDFMRELKANASNRFNDNSGSIHKFGWQEGYGAFTVGRSQQAAVIKYIENQEQHHSKVTFQDEYLDLLQKSGIEYDPRFLWD